MLLVKFVYRGATARSLITAKKVTSGINAYVLDDLFANKVYPIVYAYIDGKEKFSFVPELCSDGTNIFLDSRKGDIRSNAVRTMNASKAI